MPPEIPHIQENYVSVQHVVSNMVQQAYSELLTVLRTLPSMSADIAKKRELLNYIVQTRQQFVKLYVLCKWAAAAEDISKCIDVAAWLHGQTNCFNNVVGALFHLQTSMASAKLPCADIESALQILKYGGPIHETHGFLPPLELSPHDILRTLQNLNVLLSVRLALVEKLSPVWRNYTIKDGRAKFVVENSMQIDVGVADDSTEARFFFIDFALKFDFVLPLQARAALEQIVNQKLTTTSLQETLDWCLFYCSNCKLAHIDKQLRALERGFWSQLSHVFQPQRSFVVIKYWGGSLKVGINHQHQVVAEGEYTEFALDVNVMLTSTLKAHAAALLMPTLQLTWVEKINDLQVALNFSRTRSTILGVDYSSGRFSLGGCPLFGQAQDRLNGGSDLLETLEKLKVQVASETVEQRAASVGWEACAVRIEETEKFESKSVVVLRMRTWPLGWFVVVALETGQWWAAQLVCRERRWRVETCHKLDCDTLDPDHATFSHLSALCTKQFTMYELCREMDAAHVRYKQGAKMQLFLDLEGLNKACLSWAHSGLVATVSEKEVKLEMRLKDLKKLGDFEEPDLILKYPLLILKLHRRSAVIPQISTHLSRLNRIAEWLQLANRSQLQVKSCSLHELTLNYSPPDGVLVLKGDSVLLSKENPQHFLSPFLPSLLANGGLHSVVSTLKILYPVCATIRARNCIAIPHSLTVLRVQQRLEDKARLFVHLKVWRDEHKIYLTGNGAARSALKTVFSTPSTGCVPLRDGIAVDVAQSDSVLKTALELIA